MLIYRDWRCLTCSKESAFEIWNLRSEKSSDLLIQHHSGTAKKINRISKTLFEFILFQMTKTKAKTCKLISFLAVCFIPEVIFKLDLAGLFSEGVTRRCSVKKVFLKFLQNSKENTCAQSLFVPGLRPATLFKKRLWHSCFPANFVKFLRTLFLN